MKVFLSKFRLVTKAVFKVIAFLIQILIYFLIAIIIAVLLGYILIYSSPTFYITKILNENLRNYGAVVSIEKFDFISSNIIRIENLELSIDSKFKKPTLVDSWLTTLLDNVPKLLDNVPKKIINTRSKEFHYLKFDSLDINIGSKFNFSNRDLVNSVINHTEMDYLISFQGFHTNVIPKNYFDGDIYLNQRNLDKITGHLSLYQPKTLQKNLKDQDKIFNKLYAYFYNENEFYVTYDMFFDDESPEKLYKSLAYTFGMGKEFENSKFDLKLEPNSLHDFISEEELESSFEEIYSSQATKGTKKDKITNTKKAPKKHFKNKEFKFISGDLKFNFQKSSYDEGLTSQNELTDNCLLEDLVNFQITSENHIQNHQIININKHNTLDKTIRTNCIYDSYDKLNNQIISQNLQNKQLDYLIAITAGTFSEKYCMPIKIINKKNNSNESTWIANISAQKIPIQIYKKINFTNFEFDKAVIEYLNESALDGNITYLDLCLSNKPVDEIKQSFFNDMEFYMKGSALANAIHFSYDKDFPAIQQAEVIMFFNNLAALYEVKSFFDSSIIAKARHEWIDPEKSQVNVNLFGKDNDNNFIKFIPKNTVNELKRGDIDLHDINGNLFFMGKVFIPLYEEDIGKHLKIDICAKLDEFHWKFLNFVDFKSDQLYATVTEEKIEIGTIGIVNECHSTFLYNQNLKQNEMIINLFSEVPNSLINALNIMNITENIHLHTIFSLKNNVKTLSIISDVTKNGLKLHNVMHKKQNCPGFFMAFGKIDQGINLNLKLLSENINSKKIKELNRNVNKQVVEHISTDSETCSIIDTNPLAEEVCANKINFSGVFDFKAMDNYNLDFKLLVGKNSTKFKLLEKPNSTALTFAADMFDINKFDFKKLLNGPATSKDKQFKVFIKSLTLHNKIYLNNFLIDLDINKEGYMKGQAKARSFESHTKKVKGKKVTEIKEIKVLDVEFINSGRDNYYLVNSDDISLLLKGFDLYHKLDDGNLSAVCMKRVEVKGLEPGDTSKNLKCNFHLRKFILIDNAFLLRLISYTSLPGIMKLLMMDNSFAFSKMLGEVILRDNNLRISGIEMEGVHFDLNTRGDVDFMKKEIYLNGKLTTTLLGINTLVKYTPILRDLIYSKGNGLLFAPFKQTFKY